MKHEEVRACPDISQADVICGVLKPTRFQRRERGDDRERREEIQMVFSVFSALFAFFALNPND
jgi:hypothetical protein